MMSFRNSLILGLSLLLASTGFAQFSLPALISDNMVLQRNSSVPLWGWSTPGDQIIIETDWDGQKYNTKADQTGKWTANVNTPDAGGPYAISFTGKETVQLKNILIGEVWLCSGQSNMEMPLEGWDNQPITHSEEFINSADYPDLRLFTVERKVAYEPEVNCEGSWTSSNPSTVAKFSATGYFFGLRLYKKLGIPIGLIHSSWGGTPAEAWTSQEYINKIPYFHTSQGECEPKVFTQRKVDAHAKVQQAWLAELGFLSPETIPPWTLVGFDDSNWKSIPVPSSWDDTEVGTFEGAMELRLVIDDIPGRWRKKECVLDLGPIDEMDIAWVNGVQVGQHLNVYDWPTHRSYKIPAGVLKKGENVVAVKVANTSGLGGINGQAEVMKIFPEGRKAIWSPLAGLWKYRLAGSFNDIQALPWCDNCSEPQSPTTLYNGMIAPLIPFKIKGAIWYQGESNRYDGKLYEKIFPNMITNWRQDWAQGDFPFYFVQIAPYTYRDEFSTGLLKEAQANAMNTVNTGMVVTSDIGSLTTIHPPDKKSVGDRLANWALAKDYGFEAIQYTGPVYKSFDIEGQKIRIYFEINGESLKAEGGSLKHFTIAGKDGVFVPAVAHIDGSSVLVYSENVQDPVAVRFGWGHTDITNLINDAGLPAGPFRTDKN